LTTRPPAERQIRREDLACERAQRYLFCDTTPTTALFYCRDLSAARSPSGATRFAQLRAAGPVRTRRSVRPGRNPPRRRQLAAALGRKLRATIASENNLLYQVAFLASLATLRRDESTLGGA
jgi:hypothetical protein